MAKPTPGPTILIADDDVALLAALKARLEAAGYSVAAAQDGYSAMDRAAHLCPDLLILDVDMPAGDGFSVQSRMSKIDELASTPVIYLTGSSDVTIDQSAASMGAFAVIHKPFQTEDLLSTVASALAQAADALAS
ncbi:MAG: response regulator [Phycisphaera sp.]|nr:MAG: response regulator [Phycisphaera sp.]